MTGLTGQFQTEVPVYEAIVACAEAIDGLGWHIEGVEANRIVSRVDTGSPHPPKIEVQLGESGRATDVRITGTDTDAEPLSEDALIVELDRARAAIKASLDGAAEAPPQGLPAARQPESAPAPGPARGRPSIQRPDTGRRRLALAGFIAGLLAIGLGIVAIAIVNDDSKDPGRDLGGNRRDLGGKNSTGNAQQKQASQQKESSQSKQASEEKQSQEPSASAPQGVAETKKIRDGDELLTLTPTGVGREGSYITLEIEVAGLGNGGYDTAELESRGRLLGSNGQSYEVASVGGPGGCEPPTVTLKNGRTLDGCLPFKVPQGVQADRFQYQPFFIGGDSAEWDLK